MIRDWTPGRWALGGLVVAGTLGALFATVPAGEGPPPWLVVVVGLLALTAGVAPESPVLAVAMGLVLAWWGLGLRDGLQWPALLAAAGLLVAHLAALVAAYGPGPMAVDPETARRWVVRGGLVLLAAPGLWVVGELLAGRAEPAGVWVAGLVAALGLVLALGVARSGWRGDA